MAKRATYYEVVNFKGKNLQASPNRAFVYILALNIPNTQYSKPYYVGYADNLNFRLSNHAELNWHWNKFENPVQVIIAGTVPEVLGERTANALAQAYNDAGYIIKNDVYNRTNIDLALLSPEDLTEYANTPNPDDTVLEDWVKKWNVKTGSSYVNPSKVTHIKTFVPPQVDKTQVVEYIHSMEMVAGVRALANRIAESYDKETGYSTVFLQKEDKEYMKRLTPIFIPEKIIYHQPVRIRLTKSAAEVIKTFPN